MKNNYKSLNGYIEGYYGRLLTWEERIRIISRLNKNKMNLYFYAPKEDEKHRVNWKLKYDYKWTQNFITFCEAVNNLLPKIFQKSKAIDSNPNHGLTRAIRRSLSS